jgi:hypothetical protein
MEDESNVRVNKLGKAQRKPRAKKADPEPKPEPEESKSETETPEPEPTKPTKPTKPKPVKEEYDVEQEPDVVIHKRHKGAKPRKIIVITGDSDLDEEDEKMPYRKAPKVEVRKREVKARSPSPPPRPPRKQNVGLVGGDPKKEYHDSGKAISQPHVKPSGPKTFVVDSFIDGLLGL